MDNLISWMFGESGKKPSQSQKMWEAYFAGIQSAINNFAQEISSMVEGLCRSIASEERINEIVGACSEFNCFVAGTKIQTEDGIKSIENIKVGDEVYSENPETGEKEYKKVKQTFVHEVDTLVHVSIGDTKIDSTEGHKFWVVGKGWIEAKDLRQGDSLLESSGKIINVTDVHIERLKEKVKVYNFEVDDFHTYFVSNLGILVHNTCNVPVFRGDNSMTVKLNEVKIDKITGLLKTTHGISVNINADKVSRFGGAFRIDKIPDGLDVIQRGMDQGHYEIVPSRSMSLDEYQDLLNKIELFPMN